MSNRAPILATVLFGLAPTLLAQQPSSVPLGPNQLHPAAAQKLAPGTAPTPKSKSEIRRQASRAVTRQLLQQNDLLARQRISAFLSGLTQAEKNLLPDGAKLIDIEDGLPVFYINHNDNAAITSTVDRVRDSPIFFNVTGAGIRIGVWEVNIGSLNSHPEWAPRYTFLDSVTAASSHAAHVIGTIAASGIDPSARGMAPASIIRAYETNSDATEMATEAASSVNDFINNGRILLSNHSYGVGAGWHLSSSGNWSWRGAAASGGPTVTATDSDFGRYNQRASDWDQVCWDAPYYLPFKSAGNERDNGPPTPGTNFSYSFVGTDGATRNRTTNFNAANHPVGDGALNAGFDTLSVPATAKNILTVGATKAGVFQIQNFPKNRWLTGATSASFSSWGPTDDGRIKPDIVADGVNLYSTINNRTGGFGYGLSSGTSMASPTVCGATALLHEYFTRRFPGDVMRAATTKALILHTADDLGPEGPDYIYGWGLMNAERAAQAIKDHANATINRRINEGTLEQGVAQTFQFYWNQRDEPIRATLCWTDPASAAITGLDNRTPTLVNDLDIDIAGPAGTTFNQYLLDPENPADLATTGDNDVDNVRQVFIPNPVPGLYTLTISNDGPLQDSEQDFSLILTGHTTTPPAIFKAAMTEGAPYNEEFDSALPLARQAWTYLATGAGRATHTGIALRLDDASPSGGDSATSTATLHIDLENQKDVILEFTWRDYLDEPHLLPETTTPTPGTIPSGDGVMFSLDGLSWHRIMNFPVASENGWKTETINLDAALAAHGFAPNDYTDHVRIRFFQHGTQSFPGDGIDIDGVLLFTRSAGTFTFANPTLTDRENTNTVLLTVFRNNGSEGTASVTYITSGITADLGSDFQLTSGTLDFADGENAKTIQIPIVNDNDTEPTETLRVTLSDPTDGAALGTNPELVISIIDDDDPPVILAGPEDLYPVAIHGQDALPQSIIVRNRGGGVLNYTATEISPWISITDQGAGTVIDRTAAVVSLSYQTAHLLPGRYRGTVRIVDNDGLLPDFRISVRLLVGLPGESVTSTVELDPGSFKIPANIDGESSIYPIEIETPLAAGRISNVTTTLHRLSHGQLDDLDIILFSPAEIPVGLMSDAAADGRGKNLDLVFDGNGTPLPASGPLATGFPYSATDFTDLLDDIEELPGSAPDLFLNSIGDFTGTATDGTWELYIADDQPTEKNGELAAVTISLETVALEDVIAESFKFTSNPFDLAHTAVIFTPDLTNPAGYVTEQYELLKLPSSTEGTTITPDEDDYAFYRFTGDPIQVYGHDIETLHIGENGDIGLGAKPYSTSFANHTRIAPLYTDLSLATGSITLAELADRIAVTYDGLTEVSSGSTVSFQVEIFRDGRIRIIYGDIAPVSATIGIARGEGRAEAWSTNYSDLSTAPDEGLEIVAEDLADGINFGIAWTSQPDVLYDIYCTHDLVKWEVIDTVVGSSGTATVWPIVGQAPTCTYYQVKRTSMAAEPEKPSKP